MRRIGAFLAVAALAAAVMAPAPGAAFGLRFGPFLLHLPFGGYHHGRHWRHHVAHDSGVDTTAGLHDAAAPAAGVPPSSPGSLNSALLFPAAALPAIYDKIFWASAFAAWPFSYDGIFATAFAKAGPERSADICQPTDHSAALIERIRSEMKPSAAQEPQLQKLGGAMAMASGYLAKACPSEIPRDPVARLKLMEWQIEKLAQALDIVRQPLQDLQQSFSDVQRARFETPGAPGKAGMRPERMGNAATACAAAPTAVDASVEQISLSVQPTNEQRSAIADIREAFRSAASELDSSCPLVSPRDPVARLEAIEARLDSTWRAVVAIQVALDDFQKNLNDEQRARFAGMDFTAAQR